MSEDVRLLARLRRGDQDALCRIYEKYKGDLLTTAACLLGDSASAEDCLHDVFVKLATDAGGLGVRRNLKGYLIAGVANRARDLCRKEARQQGLSDDCSYVAASSADPQVQAAAGEAAECVLDALNGLPYEQREVVALHLHGGMTFKRIARLQDVSINTASSRYRYGIDKLRELFKEGAKHETRK